MSKHSPAPWTFGVEEYDYESCKSTIHAKPANYNGRGYGENPYVYAADGETVVGNSEYDVFGPLLDDSPGRREADIRLILAAPDLLEALQNVIAYLDDPTSGLDYDKARAAIRKATEETP